MKAKKVLSAIAVTALTATVAVGMTACSPAKLGKAKLNVKDYVAEQNTVEYNERSAPEIKTLLTANSDEVYDDYGNSIILKKGTGNNAVYSLYSLEYEKYVISGEKGVPQITSVGGEHVYKITYANDDGSSTYKLITLDGKEILTISDYYDFGYSSYYYYLDTTGCEDYYVNGEKNKSEVNYVTVERWSDGTADTSYYYFRSVTDEKTGEVSYEILKSSQLSTYGSEYGEGSYYNDLYDDVYISSKTKPVEGEAAEYRYSHFGNTYTFYKDGNKTGSVEIKNGMMLSFLDGYMYYFDINSVDPDSKKYNFLVQTEDVTVKSNYTLYRYDFVKNKTKKLNYNLAIMSMEKIYNYSTKSYDAAVISGYEIVDGFAAVGENKFTYVVDKNLKLAFDLHGEDVSFDNVKELANGKYGLGNYIVDESFNPVNKAASSGNIYQNEGLVKFSSGVYYGFTDFDGKIIISPDYQSAVGNSSSISFYGGAAYVNERQPDGSSKRALLKPDGSVTYVDNLVKTTSQ